MKCPICHEQCNALPTYIGNGDHCIEWSCPICFWTESDFVPEVLLIMSCTGERIPEDQVEFLDISEDISGRDVLRFKCPNCGDCHESHRYG